MVDDAATPTLSGVAQVASAVAQPQDEISLMVRQVQIMVKEWLVRARTLSRHSPKMSLLFRQLVARAGKPPADPSSAVELYTYWVGNILPTSTSDRQSMLGTISTMGQLRGELVFRYSYSSHHAFVPATFKIRIELIYQKKKRLIGF